MSAARCAVHPARPAHDGCPMCGRARCHADAQALGAAGCLACSRGPRCRRPAGRRELVIRAGLTGLAVTYAGGWIGTQYVRVHLMSLAAPVVIGLAASWAVSRAAGRLCPPSVVWVASVAAAWLGTALGFVLTPGGMNPLADWGVVGGPYLAALVGVLAGPLVLGSGGRAGRPGRAGQPPGEGAGDDVGTAL
jgi:hypothetical protein